MKQTSLKYPSRADMLALYRQRELARATPGGQAIPRPQDPGCILVPVMATR